MSIYEFKRMIQERVAELNIIYFSIDGWESSPDMILRNRFRFVRDTLDLNRSVLDRIHIQINKHERFLH